MKKNKPLNDLSKLGELFGGNPIGVKSDERSSKVTAMNTNCPNLGWLFFKAYYQGLSAKVIDMKNEKKQEEFFKEKNENILNAQLRNYVGLLKLMDKYTAIRMKTTYPGLIMGTGVTHETGLKGEMKLGLNFDYTTGLPYIPGPSVKGILRSVFPGSSTKADKDFKEARTSYIQDILDNKEINVEELEVEIFEGKGCESIYGRDIFMDAIIIEAPNSGKFLGSDYITPHTTNPLKNPTPIMFLKILPEVTIAFNFRLNDSVTGIKADQKKHLFERILLDIGIGAKTNVGYGQLTSIKR